MPLATDAQTLGQRANPNFVYCDELLDSRLGSPFKAGGKRSYTRKWRVRVTDNNLGANVVCQAPGVLPYSPYATPDGKEYDYQALCVDIRLEEPDDKLDGFHKIVVAEYSTEMPEGGPPRFTDFGYAPNGSQNQPWLEPPHLEWDSEVLREAPAKDLDGKAFLNAAFQPFKPAPSFEVGRALLIYERNEQSHNPKAHVRYSFAVNSDTFLGEAPGTVMLYPPRAVLKWRGGISYWRTTYKFRFNTPEPVAPVNVQLRAVTGDPIVAAVVGATGAAAAATTPLKTWQPRILNCGLMQLQSLWAAGPNFGLPIPIFRGGGAVTEPVLLDVNGRELKPLNGVWPDPNYIQFRQFLALPFTPLLVSGIGFPM